MLVFPPGAIMNFSVHLPDPLLNQLDQFAAANAKSRSSIVREAVSEYIASRTASAWPEEMLEWMTSPAKKPARKDAAVKPIEAWPDFDAIRKESNVSATKRATAL
jgi:metal-responsive CopG/Arc/MetJ family transcriptional regulator